MKKQAAITIRVPVSLKRRLEARARRERRSLSAQVVFDLEQLTASDSGERNGGAFLGRYEGARVPSDKDIREVRALLWGQLGRK